MRKRELTIAYLDFNGIPVINFPNRLLNTTAVVIEAGLLDDPPYAQGAMHSIEHFVCGASDTHTSEDVVLLMEELFGGTNGPDINIRTVWSNTAYSHLDMPSRHDAKRAFMLHATLVRDAALECHNTHRQGRTFALQSILCERAAVRNESALRGEDPYHRVSEALHYKLYKANPVRWDGRDNVRHLRKASPQTFKNWAAQHYGPDKMVLVGVGPTQKELLEWAAEAGLDQIKPYKLAKNPYDGSDNQPKLTDIREIVMERPGAVRNAYGEWEILPNHLGLAWPTETFMTKDGPALEVLARILKMRTEMRQRDENTNFDGGVYHPQGSWWATKYHGLLELWFSTVGDENYVAEAEASVLDICRRLKDEKSDALDRQCRAVRKNLASTIDQEWRWYPDRICERIIDHFTNGDRDFKQLYALPERYLAVTPADVREMANKYLTTDRYVRAAVHSVFISREVFDQAPPELKHYLQYFVRPAD